MTDKRPDVKPDNILVQTKSGVNGLELEQVQLADLENAHHLHPGWFCKWKTLGDWMWRSPEANAAGPMQKPSDMFAFGIVVSRHPTTLYSSSSKLTINHPQCIYAMTGIEVLTLYESEMIGKPGLCPLVVAI